MPSFTTRDGTEIDYNDSGGHGRVLVMLHGWGQTQAMFKHQLAGLATPDRRVITYDQRGHGVSAKPHYGYRIARLAQDFEELLDHLGQDDVDVLGWSMGVSVLWSYIDLHGTSRLGRFVSTSPPRSPRSPG